MTDDRRVDGTRPADRPIDRPLDQALHRRSSFGVNAAKPMVADRSGSGPAVVLLHGQPGSGPDWEPVARLLKPDFTVVTVDRPGYGRTGGPATGFAGNARALIEVLNRFAIDSAIAVGHSWGGGVAIAAAEHYPERIAGLVLVASVGPGEPVGWEDRLLAAPVIGEFVAGMTIGLPGRLLGFDRVQSYVDHFLTAPVRNAVGSLTRLTGARTGSPVWRSFLAEQRALLTELDELGPGLAALDLPTVILNGNADHVVRPAVGERLAAAVPGASHVVIPGVGHALPREQPDMVADAVRAVARRE
jgi:pimeloyl-ACP methyl ester carboxylesterase